MSYIEIYLETLSGSLSVYIHFIYVYKKFCLATGCYPLTQSVSER